MTYYVSSGTLSLYTSTAVRLSDKEKMAQFAEEERQIREENVRLQRKLQMEIERREQLCRHLSESESSLEMDDERSVCASLDVVSPVRE